LTDDSYSKSDSNNQNDDLYNGKNQIIFSAVDSLRRRNEPVDLVTVAKELQKNNALESAGGAGYLASISDEAPIATNVAHYSKIVKDHAVTRNMQRLAAGIVNDGFNVSDIDDYVSKAQADFLNVQTTTSKDKFFSMESLMTDTIDRVETAQIKGVDYGFIMGFPKLDNFMIISGPRLILVSARPGMGKTAFALSMARSQAKRGVKVGFLSIEMGKEELSDRLLAVEADINAMNFYKKGRLGPESFNSLTSAAERLVGLPIFVDDSGCAIQDVERKCRKMKKMGCELIFIDQLSKIRGKAGQSKYDTYTDHCNAIALLKKELRLPIFLLCQVNREVENRNDKRPNLGDLKQTGALEEDADMVMFIYRPGYYDQSVDASITEINLAKNRHGATGVEHQIKFNKQRAMFALRGI